MTGMPDLPPPRRRLRFSLRSLLLATLTIGCALGWLMHERRLIAERRAVLEAAGFLVDPFFNEELQPRWHRWLFGDDWPNYQQRFRALANTTDAQLAALVGCDVSKN